jgi:FMN-dependent NADH-azoreductase
MILLNIQSSPRGAKSASIAVTGAFLDAYQALHSGTAIDTLNVWQEDLPDFDQEAIGAKYKGVNQDWRYAFRRRIASCSAYPCGTSPTLTSSNN